MGNIKGLRNEKPKKQFIGTREYVDFDTGELKKTEGIFKDRANKLNFIMMFLEEENMYSVLAGLGSSGKVLAFILKEYNDKDGLFYFTTTNKERMIDTLGLSIGTIRFNVRSFVISDMLCPIRGAEYMLNPRVFYKGAIEKRSVMIDNYVRWRETYLEKQQKSELKNS